MSVTINGTVLPEQYTVLDGLTYEHVYFKHLTCDSKDFLKSIQDQEVSFSYTDNDELHEYPNAKILYLGNNTIYVCSWIQ